jgi:uroporphyrin-III C-methyltransferase
VVTATTKDHVLSKDVALAAKSTATVVILMGMHKLAEIVKTFYVENKKNTPVAIIQNGTRENEKVVIGTIRNIQQVVNEQQLRSPAIIIIGDVVQDRVILDSISREVVQV